MRKVRVSLFRVAGISLVAGLVLGLLLFIAGDYGRLQILRAKNFLSLQFSERERAHLLRTNQSLHDELQSLKSVHDRVLSYEQNVRERVDELALVLNSASALGVIDSEKAFPIETSGPLARLNPRALSSKVFRAPSVTRRDGVGGAEIDCAADGAACRRVARLNSLGASNDFSVPGNLSDERLVGVLDHYIDLLKTVPLGIPAVGHVSSGFGYRVSPFGGNLRLHEGVDFSLTKGSFVYGTADGVVKEVRRCATYGLMVEIEHSDHVVTRYAHLSKALVSEGEKVCRGEVIALAGSTGHSTGPHLHYEVRVDNDPRDPIKLLQLAEQLSQAL